MTGPLQPRRLIMKRLTISLAVAGLVILAFVATVAAASPTPTPTPARDQVRAHDTVATILGLTQAQIQDLRQDGLTLAQIAERQKVDPQKLIDALAAQWTVRIDARVANGGLTAAEATTLKSQVALRAKAMVYQTPTGGMRGAAVGAGPGAMGGGGMGMHRGAGNGTCDGAGPQGPAGQ
ncbi:MAG: hypothetical protein A2Z32_08505 [Chloroflexi bacterium RBG_16_69_14]|nr:MAG: hypothetical protein A2Z32_08505 [Chloroflexi bacterium RBG_16_69_14]